jgi:hypothetical protein
MMVGSKNDQISGLKPVMVRGLGEQLSILVERNLDDLLLDDDAGRRPKGWTTGRISKCNHGIMETTKGRDSYCHGV